MASWMIFGGVLAGGRVASSVRSTSVRHDFRYSSTVLFLFTSNFFFRLEGLGHRLAFRIGENQLDFLLDLLEFLIAEARQADAFLEQLERFVERQLLALEALHNLFEFG